jgi:hypothetical protein
MTVVPICLWPPLEQRLPRLFLNQPRRSLSFTWQASLDRRTGLASSREDSHRVISGDDASLFRYTGTPKSEYNKDDDDDGHLFELSKRLFTSYPKWLCRRSVSLGLLRLVVVDNNDDDTNNQKKKANGATMGTRGATAKAIMHVQDAIFGCTLLSFGRPTGRSISYTFTNTSPPPKSTTKSSTNGTHTTTFKAKTKTRTRISECVWSLPLVGGIMLYHDNQDSKARTQKEQVDQRQDALLFILRQTITTTTMSMPNDNDHKNKLFPSSQTSRKNDHDHSYYDRSIQTRVISYRPAMVGRGLVAGRRRRRRHDDVAHTAAPVPPSTATKTNWIRSQLYLHTQSVVHAYVMWRFHRYCWKQSASPSS